MKILSLWLVAVLCVTRYSYRFLSMSSKTSASLPVCRWDYLWVHRRVLR